jgi:hypothetical protein
MKVAEITFCLQAAEEFFQQALGEPVSLQPGSIELHSLIFSEVTGLTRIKGFAEGFIYVTGSEEFFLTLWKLKNPKLEAGPGPVVDDFVEHSIRGIGLRMAQLMPNRVSLLPTRVFRKVPDDPIELPPATYFALLDWKEHLVYFGLGLNP